VLAGIWVGVGVGSSMLAGVALIHGIGVGCAAADLSRRLDVAAQPARRTASATSGTTRTCMHWCNAQSGHWFRYLSLSRCRGRVRVAAIAESVMTAAMDFLPSSIAMPVPIWRQVVPRDVARIYAAAVTQASARC